MCTLCLWVDWLDDSFSHLSSLSALWLGLLQVLYSADTDGFTVHIPCTQAENSTWHFPGAGLQTGETEHSHTDRHVQNLTSDTLLPSKLLAVKLCCGNTACKEL